ncbi:DHA2 family efflux MFS transporter permease subunit [Lichenifustis flavocetrariae]|uniref:DHA2 family efflux MFS transporter permease subunit n=1 Tax=Lichenifustis flavocetrariae TaxID=2949735 RepID=A0AA41YQE3_9HYPH|nr:DHA2 family efflux MFS transporter permease subunit [Lichenifustis flavocetrariae]MCW6506621.1 DHA2 family efflux MFS transporter permease subunit [Lichenifustis flavocetrariae]
MTMSSKVDHAAQPEVSLPALRSGRRPLVPLIVAAAFLMESIDSTVLNTSIPTIATDLRVMPLTLHMAITVYTLSLAVFIPMSGWLADRVGAKRLFCGALGLFMLGSALCGASQNLEGLLAARALQGFGGAMTTPVGRLILLRSFDKRDLAWAMSFMVTPVLIGPFLGPLLGGLITTYASWRWIFYLNLPVGAAAIAATLAFIAPDPEIPRRRFDLKGFLLVALAFACLQLSIENTTAPFLPGFMRLIVALLIPGAALLYVYGARNTAHPALDLTLLRSRTFRIGVLAGSLCRVGLNGQPFLLPLLFQLCYGLSALQSGSITFTAAIGSLITRPLMVPLLRRFGFRRLMLVTPILGAIVIAGCAGFTSTTPRPLLMAYLVLSSLVSSVQFNAQNMLIYAELPPDRLSASVSIAAVAQQISMGLGISLAATFLAVVGNPATGPVQRDFTLVFLLMAVIPLLSLPQFLRLRSEDGAEVSGWRADRKAKPSDAIPRFWPGRDRRRDPA